MSNYAKRREDERVNDYNAIVDYTEMFASFAGEFVDLRDVDPRPLCLDPRPEIRYPAGNEFARATRAQGLYGIVYPSVRDAHGTCLVALFPHAVQSVAQGSIFRFTWRGERQPVVEKMEAA